MTYEDHSEGGYEIETDLILHHGKKKKKKKKKMMMMIILLSQHRAGIYQVVRITFLYRTTWCTDLRKTCVAVYYL
jgi:hypothetical protein